MDRIPKNSGMETVAMISTALIIKALFPVGYMVIEKTYLLVFQSALLGAPLATDTSHQTI